MNRKPILLLFFSGLLLLAVLEVALIWLFHQVAGLPVIDFGWLNPMIGLSSLTTGAFLVIWSVWIQYTLGKGTPSPRAATQELIVTGPYSFTRNPMTLGAALFYLGIAIWSGSTLAIGLVVVIFAALLTFIYFHETRELSQRFGRAYLEYKQQTPFLIPRLTKNDRR